MPSTLVHLALAALISSALLGDAFDRKSVFIVLAVTTIPDLDSFIALYATVGHRAALHNLVIPMTAAMVLWVDLRYREVSTLFSRWGHWGVRVAVVSIVCYAVAGVLVDLTDGIVNLFWPVHDQFYALSGEIELSDQRGIVQTFFETSDGSPAPDTVGTTDDVTVTTGVDPGPAEGETDPERLFPVVGATWELLLILTGTAVTLARAWFPQELPEE
jgi:hypothetical protein